MVILSLCKKAPDEQIVVQFNFATLGPLNRSESIIEHGVLIQLYNGEDPNPECMLCGPSQIDPTHHHKIIQKIQGGVPGSTYKFIVRIRTNLNHIYEMCRLLPVNY